MKKIRIVFITGIIVALCTGGAYGGQFTDVKSGEWFYDSVMSLAEDGLVNGYTDGSYKPQNSVTKAEALKMVMGAADIDVSPPAEGRPWAENLIKEAGARGVINDGAFDGDAFANRSEIAGYVVAAMNWQDGSYKNGIFEDTDDKNVNLLYAKNIITGVSGDDGYYYYPQDGITRAELCAVIARLVDCREELTGETAFTIKPLVKDPEVFQIANPSTQEDFEKIFLAMGKDGVYVKVILYSDHAMFPDTKKGDAFLKTIEAAYSSTHAKYPEYTGYTPQLQIIQRTLGREYSVILELSNPDFSNKQITGMKEKFFQKTDQIMEQLIGSGKITGTMTEKEKAKVLFEYVTYNTKYDLNLKPESYMGYGAANNNIAVCQGYTAFYNTLCKKAGIIAEGITGTAGNGSKTENHIWTLATIDGRQVHVDTTFGDPVPDVPGSCQYSYFCADSTFMKKTHRWDSGEFGI